jgi:molybdopterin molybdotransferase
MVSIEEAQRLITAHVRTLGVEEIDCRVADGRVLAEDISSGQDMPDVPKAAVDGYALRAEDGVAERRVVAEITAGGAAMHATPLQSGTAARIMTGAPIPPGADAVVMVEQTEEQDGVMRIRRELRPGENIHQIGQDISRGALILPRGTVIGSSEIALLATVGRVRVQVYLRPRVAVLSTGDEVQEPDAAHETGGIRDSNRYALMAAAREAGCETISLGIARDDLETQRRAILSAFEQADVLLTSGGVSMGTRDLIKPLLAELGTVHFGRIEFKPGKPTTFATITGANVGADAGSDVGADVGAKHWAISLAARSPNASPLHVFGLPGYPVSSLVSFEVFVRPALRRMMGAAQPDRPTIRVALRDPIKPSPDRPEYQRVIVSFEDGRLTARSTGAQGSSRLLSMRGANALLHVPAGTEIYPVGAELDAMVTGVIVTG